MIDVCSLCTSPPTICDPIYVLTTRTFFHIHNQNTKITLGNLTWLQKYYLDFPGPNPANLFTHELWICLPVQGTLVQFLTGKIPHAAGQLSLACHDCWSPSALEPVLFDERSHSNEKPVHRNWRLVCSPQLEKPKHSDKDLAQLKMNK